MKRVLTLLLLVAICCSDVAAQKLPDEDGRTPALEFSYFPHRQYAFVWRNWSVVEKGKLAEILGTTVENVEALATSMGLPKKQTIEKEWATHRGYITVLRRNWHLLPYEQILQLLGMSREELKFRLVEDDFLYVKLGNVKPYCQTLRYENPTPEMEMRAKDIARELRVFGKDAFTPQEPRFEFMRRFEVLQSSEIPHPPYFRIRKNQAGRPKAFLPTFCSIDRHLPS